MFSLSSAFSRLRLRPSLSCAPSTVPSTFIRHRSQLAPRKVKWLKRQKGVIPIPTGGSIKGTTLAFGDYGIRIRGNGARLTGKQLETVRELIKRKLKVIKGAQVYLRVFPDIPVCIKGNETRMGKGKGTFEFWATRVPTGRVIFEIGGVPIREELARDTLRQASNKLPVITEFVTRRSPPRLGNLEILPDLANVKDHEHIQPSSLPAVSAVA
ncbi:hypothetical protein ACEPAG_2591 [Sanghuangporus baumii]